MAEHNARRRWATLRELTCITGDMTCGQICVWLTLWRFAGPDGLASVPEALIAERCSCSLTTVKHSIAGLKQAELIESVYTGNNYRHKTAKYRIAYADGYCPVPGKDTWKLVKKLIDEKLAVSRASCRLALTFYLVAHGTGPRYEVRASIASIAEHMGISAKSIQRAVAANKMVRAEKNKGGTSGCLYLKV